jgi:FkbM family methyltransferase
MKHFRRNTWDRAIAGCVIDNNEYHVPDDCSDARLIVDVGAHIGSFSWLCCKRGAPRVMAFEALPENHELAVKNLAEFSDRCAVINRAVWRSDRRGEVLKFARCTAAVNTGGGNVFATSSDIEVQTLSLDAIIECQDAIDLLKLDCEGSEFPILYTSKRLHRVGRIVGEYHEFGLNIPDIALVDDAPPYTIEGLRAFLSGQGFVVTHRHAAGNLGHFEAFRP